MLSFRASHLDDAFLNNNRRSTLVALDVSRVDDYAPFGRRKTKPAIGHSAACRLHAAGAFGCRQPFALAIGQAIDAIGPAVGTGIQFSFADAHYSLMRTHPEETLPILFDMGDDVVIQPIIPGNETEPASPQPIQTAPYRSDP